jgi:hypothetical protein
MRIDRTHTKWIIGITLVTGIGAGIYGMSGGFGKTPPGSGSVIGLVFGSASLFCMLFASALTLRKRFRDSRLGPAQWWMRGHLWLGTLALPMALFHGCFRQGGAMTSWLMYLTYFVVVSGWIGAMFQHFLPRMMTGAIRAEVASQEIPVAIERLATEARIAALAGGPGNGDSPQDWRSRSKTWLEERRQQGVITYEKLKAMEEVVVSAPARGAAPLTVFYRDRIEPFLGSLKTDGELSDDSASRTVFQSLRRTVDSSLAAPIDDLERICAEFRALRRQRRFHRILHGWIFFHVLPSVVLIVLAIVHAIEAIRYL